MVKNDEIKLAEAKNDQIRFKSSLGKIKKGNNKKKIKRANLDLTRLLIFFTNILQWYLMQKIKQEMKVKYLKY